MSPITKLIICAICVAAIYFGWTKTAEWHTEREYQQQLIAGEDWVKKGYLGDAEREFTKAQTLCPKRPEAAERIQKVAKLRKLKALFETSRSGNIGALNAAMTMEGTKAADSFDDPPTPEKPKKEAPEKSTPIDLP